MPMRPTWSGSIQISLISIAVKIFPATNPGRQIEFHQIDREGGEVEKSDMVKGYEYAKNNYIEIEPHELKSLRIPTATTMQIFSRPQRIFPVSVLSVYSTAQCSTGLTQTASRVCWAFSDPSCCFLRRVVERALVINECWLAGILL